MLHKTFGKMIHPRVYMVICGDFYIDITMILEFGTYKYGIFCGVYLTGNNLSIPQNNIFS